MMMWCWFNAPKLVASHVSSESNTHTTDSGQIERDVVLQQEIHRWWFSPPRIFPKQPVCIYNWHLSGVFIFSSVWDSLFGGSIRVLRFKWRQPDTPHSLWLFSGWVLLKNTLTFRRAKAAGARFIFGWISKSMEQLAVRTLPRNVRLFLILTNSPPRWM